MRTKRSSLLPNHRVAAVGKRTSSAVAVPPAQNIAYERLYTFYILRVVLTLIFPPYTQTAHPIGIYPSRKGGQQDAGVPLFPTAPAACDWHGKVENREEGEKGKAWAERSKGRNGGMSVM